MRTWPAQTELEEEMQREREVVCGRDADLGGVRAGEYDPNTLYEILKELIKYYLKNKSLLMFWKGPPRSQIK